MTTERELRKHLNDFDELFIKCCRNRGMTEEETKIRKAKKALALTPAQSLKAHDDELIERCAKECEYAATPYRDADKFYICAEAVRALKGE